MSKPTSIGGGDEWTSANYQPEPDEQWEFRGKVAFDGLSLARVFADGEDRVVVDLIYQATGVRGYLLLPLDGAREIAQQLMDLSSDEPV